jgi:hypothetical protein
MRQCSGMSPDLADMNRLASSSWISRSICVMRKVAVAVLAVCGIAAVPARSDPWKALHRPLRIPILAPGTTCPLSPTQPAPGLNPAFGGYVLGRGPAYAGAVPQDAIVHYAGSPVEAGGWRGFKVFWIVRPRYRGRLLIRGRQLDGTNRIRFAQGAEMRIGQWGTAAGAPGWGERPSTEWVRAPGCYGFQVDGQRFSRVLVFRAEP